jgi:hypothetical protein
MACAGCKKTFTGTTVCLGTCGHKIHETCYDNCGRFTLDKFKPWIDYAEYNEDLLDFIECSKYIGNSGSDNAKIGDVVSYNYDERHSYNTEKKIWTGTKLVKTDAKSGRGHLPSSVLFVGQEIPHALYFEHTIVTSHRVYAKFLMEDIHDLKAYACTGEPTFVTEKEVTVNHDDSDDYIGYRFTYRGEKWLVLSYKQKKNFVRSITKGHRWSNINSDYGNIILPTDVKPQHVLIEDLY